MALLSKAEKQELNRISQNSSTAGIKLKTPKHIPVSEPTPGGQVFVVCNEAGEDAKSYTGDVVVSDTDSTAIIEDVNIRAHQVTAGTVPLGTPFLASKIGDFYYIEPSIIYGE